MPKPYLEFDFQTEFKKSDEVKMYYVPAFKVMLVKESQQASHKTKISTSQDVYDIAKSYLYGADREHFVVIMLDIRNYIIGINTVTIGNIQSCIVNPREVFKPALIAGASSVILVHNHPSGDVYPSPDDLHLTDKLKQAGDILQIKVIDHIIVTDSNYLSLKDKGQM